MASDYIAALNELYKEYSEDEEMLVILDISSMAICAQLGIVVSFSTTEVYR